MSASPATLDFSTFGRPLVDVWSGADETQSKQRHERERAGLLSLVTGPTISAFSTFTSYATCADYSILGRATSNRDILTSAPGTTRSLPVPFLEAYCEILSFKNLEDGWDGIESERVSGENIESALEFLSLLPSDITPPEASLASDGTVDWYWRNGSYAATVTFHKNGRVAYFALTNSGSTKDTFKLNGSIPSELVESLQQL